MLTIPDDIVGIFQDTSGTTNITGWRVIGESKEIDTATVCQLNRVFLKTDPDAWLGEFIIGILVNTYGGYTVLVDPNCPESYFLDSSDIMEVANKVVKANSFVFVNKIKKDDYWYCDGTTSYPYYAPYISLDTTTASGVTSATEGITYTITTSSNA